MDNTEVFMDQRELPAFTHELQDPIELSDLKGIRATTFRIPATTAVQAVVGGVAMSERNPPKHTLRIGEAGQVYFEGPVVPVELDREEYRMLTVGGNASWFKALGAKKLTEVDLGKSEIIDLAYMQASWVDETEVLHFPLINYGQILDTHTATTNNSPDIMRPAIRVHRLLRKAFGDEGYALKVTGGFARLWPKLVLPSTTDDIQAADIEVNNASTLQSVPVSIAPAVSPGTNLPQDTIVSDAGGNINGSFFYVSTLDQTARCRLNITFTVQYAAQFISYTAIPIRFNVVQNLLGLQATRVVYVSNYWLAPQTVSVNLDFGEFDMIQGGIYRVTVQRYSTDPLNPLLLQFDITTAEVEWEITNVEYQEGIKIVQSSGAPNISCMDLVKSLATLFCLSVDTDPRTKVVTLQYCRDKYKDPAQGIQDFSSRLDSTDPPVKNIPVRARRLLFKYREDDDDFDVSLLNETIGERTYGGHIHQVPDGVDDDKDIDVSFAATAMQIRALEGLSIPVIREHDGLSSETEFTWSPRLLIADGILPGNWVIDGTSLTEYPKTYFVFPGEDLYSLSFGQETFKGDTAAGTTAQYWSGRLLRYNNSYIFECDLLLYDDEIQDIDFGVPVLIHDGEEAGVYYFLKIRQHKYGAEETTRCEFIQC